MSPGLTEDGTGAPCGDGRADGSDGCTSGGCALMEAGAVYVAPRCRGAADVVVGRTRGADCCTSIGTGGAGRASRPLYVAIGYDALEEGAMCSDVVGPRCECVVPVSSTRGEVCERADHVAPVAGCGVCRAEAVSYTHLTLPTNREV